MDIEQFYSADERRRQSAEVEFGNNWFDAKGSRYELSWVEDTGELYAMLELTPEAGLLDAVRRRRGGGREGRHPAGDRPRYLRHPDEVEALLDGWADHMAEPDGVHWVAERLQAAGVARPTLD